MQTVLVTGGAGFIGSAVVRHMIHAGIRVINFDKLTYAGNPESLKSIQNAQNYRFVEGDINNAQLVLDLLRSERVYAIMHLAAESHVDRSIDDASVFVETNVVGTFRLLSAALSYWRELDEGNRSRFRFHHISTDEVFGDLPLDSGIFREDTSYAPSSPYSASKAASDHFVRAWGHTYGLPIVVSNCSNNYGPFHFPEKLIPLTILNALEGKPLPVYGKGENVRDWLYVEDHVRALALILSSGRVGESYNVGGGQERSNLSVVETICDLLDAKVPLAGYKSRRDLITFAADRPGHDLRYAIDAGKIEHELGWRAEETFETGLAKTIDWYLENRWWWEPIRNAKYGGERMGARI